MAFFLFWLTKGVLFLLHLLYYRAFSSFLLQLSLVLTVIASLIVLRKDASNYVLGPLRSMLKIVARYAKNPLQATSGHKDYSVLSESDSEAYIDDEDDEISQAMEFQTDETEQLIRAVAKITDLLVSFHLDKVFLS